MGVTFLIGDKVVRKGLHIRVAAEKVSCVE